MIIAIIGFDGVGKSSIIRHLSNYNKNNKIIVVQGYKSFLEMICSTFFKKTDEKIVKFQKSSGFNCFIPYLIFLDSLFRFFYYRILSFNKTVIYDRYFYDYIVSYSYEKQKDKFGILSFLYHLFPKPKYIYCLICSPKTAYLRKKRLNQLGDTDINYFISQKKGYLNLAKKKKLKIIDTTNLSIKAIVKIIGDEIKNG